MSILEDFVHSVGRLFKIRKRSVDQGIIVLTVDLTPLRLNFHPFTPFLLIPSDIFASDREGPIIGLIRDIGIRNSWIERPCFVVIDANVDITTVSIKSEFSQFVVLNRELAQKAIRARSISDIIVSIARTQLSRVILSPYETSRPVTGSGFYGRESQIRIILSNPETSYVLLGMRRVGKTSVLKELKRRMEDDEVYMPKWRRSDGTLRRYGVKSAEEPVVFIDCSPHKGDDLLYTIIEWINPRLIRRFTPTRYTEILRTASAKGKFRIQIFLDEIDKLIEYDKKSDWRILELLRASAIEGYARYVFAGQQQLREVIATMRVPLFNFVHSMPIGPFASQVAMELIREPLRQLGISVDDQIVQRIIRESGGHPNIIQFYCQFFVNLLEEEGRDKIQPGDIDGLVKDPNFDMFVMTTFEVNTSVVEKLIVLLMVESDAFIRNDIYRTLRKKRILFQDNALQQALGNLIYAGILEENGDAYQFKLPVLKRLLNTRYDVPYLINQVRIEHPGSLVKVN